MNEMHTLNALNTFNELHTWLSQQHHGLRTFRAFQQKLDDVSRADPGQRALCRLLDTLVGSHVDRFDEEPLPVEVADLAYQRLLDLSPVWTSTPAATGAWPTSTAWQRAICGARAR